MARNDETVLSLRGLHKSFGGLKVIDDVSFGMRRGQRMALIGPNGAGKTTIFNLISGIYQVDAGSILLDGVDITHVHMSDRAAHGLSRSFQNIRLMPHLSTVENVMLGHHIRARGLGDLLKPLGWGGGRSRKRKAEEFLKRFGIETYPGQVVANLPYGTRKRIEVVRALMAEPRVLMLDEPAAGLNARETADLQALLRQVSEHGVTLLVVEHDMHFVKSLCDHVIVLNFGRKIFDGRTADVSKDRAVLEAYLGTDIAEPTPKERSHAS